MSADSEETNIECQICLDEYKENETIMTLPCFHEYHEECISIWLRQHNFCPICRHPITELDINNNDDANNNQ